MTQEERRGLVFSLLRGDVDCYTITSSLHVEFSTLVSWMRGAEIPEKYLPEVLQLFKCSLSEYEWLCSTDSDMKPRCET